LREGRNINDRDMSSAERNCVIGQTIVENLFPDGNAMGKMIRINSAPFKVIGILEEKGQSANGQDQDDIVIIPLTTAQRRVMGITYIRSITIQAQNENVINDVQAEVEQLLRIRHRIKDTDTTTFPSGTCLL
jgi:putative ABC transport system permease protein